MNDSDEPIELGYSSSPGLHPPSPLLLSAAWACGIVPLLVNSVWLLLTFQQPPSALAKCGAEVVPASLLLVAAGIVAAFWYYGKAHAYQAGRTHYTRKARKLLAFLVLSIFVFLLFGFLGAANIEGPSVAGDLPRYRFVINNLLGRDITVYLVSDGDRVPIKINAGDTSHAVPIAVHNAYLAVEFQSRRVHRVRGLDLFKLSRSETYVLDLSLNGATVNIPIRGMKPRARMPTTAPTTQKMPPRRGNSAVQKKQPSSQPWVPSLPFPTTAPAAEGSRNEPWR